MAAMSNYIKKLEGYGDLEVSIIRATKINKVLKALIKLNTIPKDEEFNFRGRSVELLGKWNKILGSEPVEAEGNGNASSAAASGAADNKEDTKPTTNGTHKEDEKTEANDAPAKASVEPKETKQVVVDSLAKETSTPATTAAPEIDAKPTEAPKPVEDGPVKESEPVKVLDQAPISAAGAAEANKVAKTTE